MNTTLTIKVDNGEQILLMKAKP